MANIIAQQNKNILDAWWGYKGKYVVDNLELAKALNIDAPPQEYRQDYVKSDIRVMVI